MLICAMYNCRLGGLRLSSTLRELANIIARAYVAIDAHGLFFGS